MMKRTFLFFLSLVVISGTLFTAAQERTPTETVYFAMEMNGKLIGYSETDIYPGKPGGEVHLEKTTLVLKLKALGQAFDVNVVAISKTDPATEKLLFLSADMERGDQKLNYTYVFEGNVVHIKPSGGGQERTLTLDDDVLMDDTLSYQHLVADFAGGQAEFKTYKVFNYIKGEVHERKYTLKGEDTLQLLDREFDCLVFDVMDFDMGLGTKLWVDKSSGRAVRAESTAGINSYLADSTVKMMIVRGDLDDRILGEVDVAIADFQSISYMKVRARIRTLGEWVTPETLNVPGQKFEGTVTDNLIDGVFEIEHKRYDGAGAPAFPCDYSGDDTMKEFLEPEDMVEANDPVLIEKAWTLAKGSKDSWEAACRLSKWVAEEIGYEIPGGSARFTFDKRKGECGSHSRLLTALCRGAGIPARFVTGCMYTPLKGGSFGQHVWNEIYMGDAGWITVDSTAKEVDYVDSGHIRIGREAGFNPEEMEVLDYKAGALEMGQEPAGMEVLAEVPWKVGETYTFNYLHNGNKIGSETLTVTSADKTISSCIYSCTAKIEFPQTMTGSVDFKLDQNGFPLSFNAEATVRGNEVKLNCAFSDGKVEVKLVQGGQPVERTVDLPEKVYLISNNNVTLLAFLALTAPREVGETRAFMAFHPPSMQVFPGQVTVKSREAIQWCGREVECRLLDFSLAGTPIRMWVDDTGRLLRESEQGGVMVVELTGEEG